ncbi:MAG: hypothetical protein ACJA01_003379 [Saprospiraceae bacterium]|jgi:hypothetical protein
MRIDFLVLLLMLFVKLLYAENPARDYNIDTSFDLVECSAFHVLQESGLKTNSHINASESYNSRYSLELDSIGDESEPKYTNHLNLGIGTHPIFWPRS